MKAYELAWKLLKHGPFCEVELCGAIDNESFVTTDILYVGKNKGITRVAG